jgi:hypothetical protein
MLILSLLVMAINFNLTDNYITDSVIGRRGVIHLMIISWQTLLMVSGFCVFLRYISCNIR